MKLKNIAVARDDDGIDVSVTLRFMSDDVIGMTAAVERAMVEAFETALRHAETFGEPAGQHKEASPCAPSPRQAPQNNDAPTPRRRASSTATSAEPTNQNDAVSPPAAGVSGTTRRARSVKSAEATTAAPTAGETKPSENELGASRRSRRVADPQSSPAGGAAGATPPAEKPATEPAAPRRGRPPRQATASAATAPSTAPATATTTSPSSKLPSTVDVSKALTVAGGKIGPKMVKEYAEEWGISSAHDVPEMSRRDFIDGLEQLVKANGG